MLWIQTKLSDRSSVENRKEQKVSRFFKKSGNVLTSKMLMKYGNSIYCYLSLYYFQIIILTIIIIRFHSLYHEQHIILTAAVKITEALPLRKKRMDTLFFLFFFSSFLQHVTVYFSVPNLPKPLFSPSASGFQARSSLHYNRMKTDNRS